MALIALCEDDRIKGYRGFTVKSRLWKNPQRFEGALDSEIGRMLEDIKRIAEIWMQAKPKPEPAPKTTSSNPEPIIARPSGCHDAAGSSSKEKGKAASVGSKAKGKGKATDLTIPAKRESVDEGGPLGTLTKKCRLDQEEEDQDDQKEKGDRDEQEDKAAQEKVRHYYNQISVPTGHGMSEGAHIFSVSARARADTLWDLLANFWTEEEVATWDDAITSSKGRLKNILPMEPTAHALFDRFTFALRPVRCPEQPDKRIYLQFDMDLEVDPDKFKRRQPKNLLPLINYRAPVRGKGEGNQAYEVIRHGQILEIENTDGDENKLPSFDILDITYTLTRIIGALRSAGLLALMFQGQPPEVDPVAAGKVTSPATTALANQLPAFQEAMLEAALEAGVITEETMPGWRQVAVAQEVAKQADEDQRILRLMKAAGLVPEDQDMGDEEDYQQGGSDDEPGTKKPNQF